MTPKFENLRYIGRKQMGTLRATGEVEPRIPETSLLLSASLHPRAHILLLGHSREHDEMLQAEAEA